jgi:hypothetical protein
MATARRVLGLIEQQPPSASSAGMITIMVPDILEPTDDI